MKIKKCFLFLLAAAMMMSLFSVTAFADENTLTVYLLENYGTDGEIDAYFQYHNVDTHFSVGGDIVHMQECDEQDGYKIYRAELSFPSDNGIIYEPTDIYLQYTIDGVSYLSCKTVVGNDFHENNMIDMNFWKGGYPTEMVFVKYTPSPYSKTENADVKAKYVEGSESETIYSVDVEWGAMEFTYTAASQGTWDPETHTYYDIAEAEWSAEGNTVKVTNHSNAPVDAAFSYTKETGFESVTGTFSVDSETLDAGVENEYDKADSVTCALTLSGDLADTAADFTKVGTITVTLSES